MKKTTLLLLLHFIIAKTFAQTDSMLAIIPSLHDTDKVNTYNKLAWDYVYKNTKESRAYAMQSLQISRTAKFKSGEAKAINILGIGHDVESNYDSAIYYYNQSLAIHQKLNNTKGIASSKNNIGLVYWNWGMPEKALVYFFEAKNAFKEINDTLHLANVLNNLCLIYYDDLKKYKQSLYFGSRAFDSYKSINHIRGMGASANNIANTFQLLKNYDSALYYFKLSIEYKSEANDQYGLGKLYHDYAGYWHDLNKYETAIQYMNYALNIERNNSDINGMSRTYLSISNIYNDINKTAIAIQYLDSSMALAKEVGSIKNLEKIYRRYSRFHGILKNYKQAFEYSILHKNIYDSIHTLENEKQILELNEKYQSAEKDRLIAQQENEINQRRAMNRIIIISSLSLMIVLILLFRQRRLRLLGKMAAERLAEQKERNRLIIETEEHERTRIAKEIHDGVGQQIAAAKLNLSATIDDVKETIVKSKLEKVQQLIDDTATELREVSHQLIPAILLRKGLPEAINELVGNISSGKKIKIHYSISGFDSRLDPTIETVLYRVIQECVNNVLKHAQASELNILLTKHHGSVNMLIEDNGKGFDTNNSSRGIGIKNMISRIEFLNGSIEFDSTNQQGTTVNILIPL